MEYRYFPARAEPITALMKKGLRPIGEQFCNAGDVEPITALMKKGLRQCIDLVLAEVREPITALMKNGLRPREPPRDSSPGRNRSLP